MYRYENLFLRTLTFRVFWRLNLFTTEDCLFMIKDSTDVSSQFLEHLSLKVNLNLARKIWQW